MNPLLLQVALDETPNLIALFRALFSKRHPDEPWPTDEQVVAAFNAAFAASLAKDAQWLALHPEA